MHYQVANKLFIQTFYGMIHSLHEVQLHSTSLWLFWI